MKRFNPDDNNQTFGNAAAIILNVSENVLAEIDSLVRTGEKLQAIKLYRAATGLGLADAKEEIEKYYASILK